MPEREQFFEHDNSAFQNIPIVSEGYESAFTIDHTQEKSVRAGFLRDLQSFLQENPIILPSMASFHDQFPEETIIGVIPNINLTFAAYNNTIYAFPRIITCAQLAIRTIGIVNPRDTLSVFVSRIGSLEGYMQHLLDKPEEQYRNGFLQKYFQFVKANPGVEFPYLAEEEEEETPKPEDYLALIGQGLLQQTQAGYTYTAEVPLKETDEKFIARYTVNQGRRNILKRVRNTALVAASVGIAGGVGAAIGDAIWAVLSHQQVTRSGALPETPPHSREVAISSQLQKQCIDVVETQLLTPHMQIVEEDNQGGHQNVLTKGIVFLTQGQKLLMLAVSTFGESGNIVGNILDQETGDLYVFSTGMKFSSLVPTPSPIATNTHNYFFSAQKGVALDTSAFMQNLGSVDESFSEDLTASEMVSVIQWIQSAQASDILTTEGVQNFLQEPQSQGSQQVNNRQRIQTARDTFTQFFKSLDTVAAGAPSVNG